MNTDLNVTVGALLLGVLVSSVGFGITTLQTYHYFNRFPKDPKLVRLTVLSLLLLDTSHVVLSWHMVYYYLISRFGNIEATKHTVWSLDLTIGVTAVITVIVHCFYARRVFILSARGWLLTLIILVLSIVRLVFGLIVTAKIFVLTDFDQLPHQISPDVGTALGSGTAADCLITGSLVFYLRRHQSGFNQLDGLLNRITYWTVNNGMLTSVVGLVVVATFSSMSGNMIFLAFHVLLSKLYSNSLLATLNFRVTRRGRGLDEDTEFISMSTLRRADANGVDFHDAKNETRKAPVAVHIMTTTTTDQEGVPAGDSIKTDPFCSDVTQVLKAPPV